MFKLLLKYTKDGWWAALLGPIFVIIEVIFDTVIPYVMALIIDEGITARGGDINYIIRLGVIMVILAIAAGLCGALSGVFASIASCRFIRNARTAIFEKIQTFDFKNIEKFPVSSVVMRMTTDMRNMRMAYVSIVRMMVRTLFNLIASAYMVFRLNNQLAAIFAIAIPVLGTGLIYMMSKAHPRFVVLMSKFDKLNADIKENVENQRVVKSFVRQDHETEKFANSSWIVTKAQRYAENMIIYNEPFFQLVMYSCL